VSPHRPEKMQQRLIIALDTLNLNPMQLEVGQVYTPDTQKIGDIYDHYTRDVITYPLPPGCQPPERPDKETQLTDFAVCNLLPVEEKAQMTTWIINGSRYVFGGEVVYMQDYPAYMYIGEIAAERGIDLGTDSIFYCKENYVTFNVIKAGPYLLKPCSL
jgi:hypothetical protein